MKRQRALARCRSHNSVLRYLLLLLGRLRRVTPKSVVTLVLTKRDSGIPPATHPLNPERLLVRLPTNVQSDQVVPGVRHVRPGPTEPTTAAAATTPANRRRIHSNHRPDLL